MNRISDVLRRVEELSTSLFITGYTVAHMDPSQVVGMGERVGRQFLVPKLPVNFDRRYDQKVPDRLTLHPAPIRENTTQMRDSLSSKTRRKFRERSRAAAAGEVTFLNRTHSITDESGVDWKADNLKEVPLLWWLKLYAFEPIEWILLGFDPDNDEAATLRKTFDRWIDDWMDEVEIGEPNYLRRTWTPYAVSLRILNWSRYLATYAEGTKFDAELARGVYKNASFLSNHVESDVGGNHLIENGAALVAAGLLFGDDGRSWVGRGLSILEDAAEDQFLVDGCHYERSPMYHVQTLTRYLSIRDLLIRADQPVPESIDRIARDGVAFLSSIRPPNGKLPLLNDAVRGQTLTLDECLEYASATSIDVSEVDTPWGDGPDPSGGTSARDHSGLGWLDTESGRMLIDGGAVGPPHLPGHSHSDLLSYLLWLGDSPIITDTGTFDYSRGPRRIYSRGVRGHNSVQVDEVEPIELTGKYLMGPRPVPTTRWERGDIDVFEGYYRTRPFRGPGYHHNRLIAAGDRWWLVWDRVSPTGHDDVRSRIHLHPDVTVTRDNSGRTHLNSGDAPAETVGAWLHPLDRAELSLTDGPYFPEFGTAIDRPVLTVESALRPSTPTGFGYILTTVETDSPTVKIGDQSEATALTIGNTEHPLPRPILPRGSTGTPW